MSDDNVVLADTLNEKEREVGFVRRVFRWLLGGSLTFFARHDRLRWLLARYLPGGITARLIRLVGLDLTTGHSGPENVADAYAAAADVLLDVAPAPGRDASPGKQFLVDITVIGSRDARTGIQRATRNLLRELAGDPPEGYRVMAVFRSDGAYRYARPFAPPVEVAPGDLFLAIDIDLGIDRAARDWLTAQSSRGLKIYFVVHDLLSLHRPDWFPSYSPPLFLAWLEGVAGVADGLVCVSKSVADDLSSWLSEHPGNRPHPPRVAYFHHGADIEASPASPRLSPSDNEMVHTIAARTTALMVGTVEPRKGHAQALDAFEILWAESCKNLPSSLPARNRGT